MMSNSPEDAATKYFAQEHDNDYDIQTFLAFVDGYKTAQKQEQEYQFKLSGWVEPMGTIPRWIPISESLPEEDVTVLAFVNYSVGDAELRLVTSAAYRGKLWLCGRDIYSEGFVTHWMPLPNPPEATNER